MHTRRTLPLPLPVPLIPWLLCAAACGPASSLDETTATESQATPLLGAPEDHEHRYDVGVCRQAPNQDPALGEIGACLGRRPTTGTLVAPNLVLLGRGTVDRATFPAGQPFCNGTFTRTPPAVLKVTLSDSAIRGNPVWLDVDQVIYPPTDRFCDDGLALLVLHDNVPARAARPVDIDVGRDVAVHPPRAYALLGRGSVALHVDPITFAITEDTGGFTRRILKNVPFVCASNTDEACSIVDITSDLPNDLFKMPKSLMLIGAGLSLGDGSFIDQSSFEHGRPKIVAVGTFIPIGENGDPNGSIGVRTSLHRDFLVQSARTAAQKGHYAVPRWARDCDGDENE
ncbi:hypothetical protein LVJ94_02705 [Pendulispora rubella]|uniref:Uncharacterized protein n=1 Tax=Pendulispora rubella TaxID=2741070 RepID=A0ABZ2L5F6_9BACT